MLLFAIYSTSILLNNGLELAMGKSVLMADVIGFRKDYPHKWRTGGQKIDKTRNICSIVVILVQY